MFSARALHYLTTLERREHVVDLGVVREALARHGIPPLDVCLAFHAALAGYVEPAGRDEFVYGIIHQDSYWYGQLSPEASHDDGIWYVTYADGDPTYGREMDEHGILYGECRSRQASSFVSFIEQRAFIAEFWGGGPTVRKYVKVPPTFAPELKARLEPLRVTELCDGIATVWTGPTFCLFAADSSDWLLWMRPDSPLGELTPFVLF